MLICYQYIFFGEISVKDFSPIFHWAVCILIAGVKSSLYIMDTSSLSDVSFENVFSQFVACLLILLTLSFAEQKF